MFYMIDIKKKFAVPRKELEIFTVKKKQDGYVTCRIADVAITYDMGHEMYMGGIDKHALMRLWAEIMEAAC